MEPITVTGNTTGMSSASTVRSTNNIQAGASANMDQKNQPVAIERRGSFHSRPCILCVRDGS